MPDTTPLKVFLTGASTGIGEAFVRHYAARGAQLGLVARRQPLLDTLAANITPRPATYACDVRDSAALIDAAKDFIARFGVPDIVIANAGVSIGTASEKSDDLAVFKEVMDINVLGMLHTFHPFIEPMKQAQRGTLAGIASVAGFRGIPGGSAYSASKAAAITYLESLRVELKSDGVKVVTICPGYIKTQMTAVNRFKMPFLIDAEEAVRRFSREIDRGSSFKVIPWQMAIVGRVLHLVPNWLYDMAFSRMPRKPRRDE